MAVLDCNKTWTIVLRSFASTYFDSTRWELLTKAINNYRNISIQNRSDNKENNCVTGLYSPGDGFALWSVIVIVAFLSSLPVDCDTEVQWRAIHVIGITTATS